MKCIEIDFIKYTEGYTTVEMKNHVQKCPACREELARFSMFMNGIMPAYKEGKRLEDELDKQLAEIDLASMKPLPAHIAKKVKEMRNNSLVGRLKKIIGENRKGAQDLIESILNPRMDALPASPRDITKTKKAKPKQKKALPKKRKKKST